MQVYHQIYENFILTQQLSLYYQNNMQDPYEFPRFFYVSQTSWNRSNSHWQFLIFWQILCWIGRLIIDTKHNVCITYFVKDCIVRTRCFFKAISQTGSSWIWTRLSQKPPRSWPKSQLETDSTINDDPRKRGHFTG